MRGIINLLLARFGNTAANAVQTSDFAERSLLLQGRQAALLVRSLEKIGSLPDAGFRVYSQFDEDGIIEWLVGWLPGIPSVFIEFGVEDYSEANTRFLLRHRNWRGLVMDGSAENVARIKMRPGFWQNDLTAVAAFIDRDNINATISANKFDGEVGILSIDIDGNDYWVWEAMETCNPWIVIVEYSAVLGDLHPITVPYEASFFRTAAHFSNLYGGASICALENLANKRGYVLTGSNLAGHNAFFVRRDIYLRYLEGRIADMRPRPSLYRESKDAEGNLSFVHGADRKAVIARMPVLDIVKNETVSLGSIPQLYSDFWLEIMG